MANITYYLGAGASFNSNPILEKQAEMMIYVATEELIKRPFNNEIERENGIYYNFNDSEYQKIPENNSEEH